MKFYIRFSVPYLNFTQKVIFIMKWPLRNIGNPKRVWLDVEIRDNQDHRWQKFKQK